MVIGSDGFTYGLVWVAAQGYLDKRDLQQHSSFRLLIKLKKSKDIRIEEIWLVGFYGISILVAYLMPNSFYTHVY